MVKVTVIATGFDSYVQPVEEQRQVRNSFPNSPPVHRPSMMNQPVRNALQMRPSPDRQSISYANTQSQPPQQRNGRPTQVPVEQALVAATRPSGFGASALHDERVLDIPAYLRRGGGNNGHE